MGCYRWSVASAPHIIEYKLKGDGIYVDTLTTIDTGAQLLLFSYSSNVAILILAHLEL